MGASGYTYIEVEVVLYDSGKAFLVRLKDSEEQVWIPHSCISPDDLADLEKGDKDRTIAVADWFCEREEIG